MTDAQRKSLKYEDFVVRIGPDDGKGYRLHVVSPVGEGSGFLKLPFSDDELAPLAASEKGWRPPSSGQGQADTTAAAMRPPSELRKLGCQLFDALFPSGIRELYYESRGRVEERLRLRLQIDPCYPELRRLFSLPWELLHPNGELFLALSRETPIVRHPEVAQPAGNRSPVRQLRVLAVMAGPEDQRPLDLQREWEVLETIWRKHLTVRLVRLENPTLDALRDALEDGGFHVLHFMGHGGFDTDQGEWAVCFQGEEGKTEYVAATLLAEELAGFRHTVRLVVLNACQTARVCEQGPDGPFPGVGVAMAMVSAGFTAIVAMQAIISDRAAIELSKALYHQLAAGDPVERAVAVARKRIRRHERTGAVRPAEWATPVLFLRTKHGELFEVPEENAKKARPRSWRPSGIGLVALASGGLGLALLAGLGSLWLWESSPLQYAATVTAAVFGGLGWVGRQLWAAYDSKVLTGDLSQAIAARGCLLALLFSLPLLANGGWLRYGIPKLESLSCAPLGSRQPGAQRVAVVPFTAPDDFATRQERLWAGEMTDQLTDKLRQLDSLEVLVWRNEKPEKLGPRCIDVTVSGKVWQDRGVHLRVALTDPKFREKILEKSDQPDDFGSIDHFQGGLILEVVKALGIEITPEQRRLLQAVPTSDPDARNLNRRGVLAFLGGHYDEAESKFRGALALDPQYSSAYNNLGRVLMTKEEAEYEAAIDQFRRAIAIKPHHATYYLNLGLALERHATSLRRTDPEDPAFRQLLQQAVTAYEQAIAYNRADALAYNNLGFTLLGLGELELARETLEQGRGLATEEELKSRFEKNLGRTALEQGRPEQAVEHLERAIRLYPDFPEALYFLARAQEALAEKGGLPAEATCRTLERYLELADRDPETSHRQDAWERLTRPPCGD